MSRIHTARKQPAIQAKLNMHKDRTSGQLAGIFMSTGAVTCFSPEEYTAFSDWIRLKEVPVTTDVHEETGNVTFEAASADAVVSERELATLIAMFHELGSVVMSRDEHDKFVFWARSENVPLHDQFDRKIGKFVVMKRGWGTVEGA